MPNTNKMEAVNAICYTSVTIPRMFDTVTGFNDTLQFWARQVIEISTTAETGVANQWLRTVSPTSWTPVTTLKLPHGQTNLTQILAYINGQMNPGQVWSYDSTNRTLVILFHPPGGAIAWGYFIDPGHVPPAVSYAPMIYITAGGTDSFETLGLQRGSDLSTQVEDRVPFDRLNPNTFDTVVGTNLSAITVLPLFNRPLHNYAVWSTVDYTTPIMNPPNLSGPTLVWVAVDNMVDSSGVDAGTGNAYALLTSVALDKVDFGREATREVKDSKAEGHIFVAPRTIRSFKVRLLDRKLRQLVLPRNYPVHLSLQISYTDR